MKKLLLFHGSNNIIEKPIFGYGNKANDYGLGFYLTKNIELAKEWSTSYSTSNCFVNKYEINIDGLKVLDLTDKNYTILNWIAILMKHRRFDISQKLEKRKQFLIDNYYIDVNEFDIIIGYRADDSYFRFAKDFINNSISINDLNLAMNLGNLGKQVVLKSKKAFDLLTYLGNDLVDKDIYLEKRNLRDRQARQMYLDIGLSSELDGTYIVNIINGGVNHVF